MSPIEKWNYNITYVKTLAVLLARMGQKVTFFQPTDVVAKENAADTAIAKYALERITAADSVYDYHVDLLLNLSKRSGESEKLIISELIRQCVARFNLPTVVVASHPDVFFESRVPGIKYIVPDICDPLNRERFVFEDSNIPIENYIAHMAKHADAMFLSGPAMHAAKKMFGNKIYPAFPSWEGPSYQILNMELDFTPNYIQSEQMLQNAVALLDV